MEENVSKLKYLLVSGSESKLAKSTFVSGAYQKRVDKVAKLIYVLGVEDSVVVEGAGCSTDDFFLRTARFA